MDHCDQFMFNQSCIKLLENTARVQVGKLQEFACDHAPVQILLEISTILRNNDLLVNLITKLNYI